MHTAIAITLPIDIDTSAVCGGARPYLASCLFVCSFGGVRVASVGAEVD